MLRTLSFASVVTAALLVAPACVSGQIYRDGRYGTRGPADYQRVAYDNGYRRGFERGLADARSGRRYDVRNDALYRAGDWGYNPQLGPRGQYRQAFRGGYERGYAEGYRDRGGAARGGYGYPGDYRGPVPGRYPGNVGSPGRGYGYASPAYDYGYRDGLDKGLEDLRDHKSYDPIRHKWYREGDRHYDSRYGSREEYKQIYREGFRAGYDAAARGGARGR